MKRQLAITCIGIFSGLIAEPFAFAADTCEHYEFAELQAMKKTDLELAYCLFQIRKNAMEQLRAIADERLMLEVQVRRPEGREATRIREEQSTLDLSLNACSTESSRVLRELINKKSDIKALVARCSQPPKP